MSENEVWQADLRKKVVKTQLPLGTGLVLVGIILSILGVISEGVRFSVGAIVFMFSSIPTWPWGKAGILEIVTAYAFEALIFGWVVSFYGIYMMVTALI